MYTIRVTAQDKKNLPATMLVAVRRRRKYGLLDDLVHAKDDVIREVPYGWEMISYWSTPEEAQDPLSMLNNNIVYEECLEKATDMLYRLLDVCGGCVMLPEINIVLSEIAERLKELEV